MRVRLLTPDAGAAREVLLRLGMAPESRKGGAGSDEAGSPGMDGEVVTAGAAVAARLGMPPPEDIVAELVAAGVRVRGFSVEWESLEERFVALTGEGFDVAQ